MIERNGISGQHQVKAADGVMRFMPEIDRLTTMEFMWERDIHIAFE
jgi:hypothetical protein